MVQLGLETEPISAKDAFFAVHSVGVLSGISRETLEKCVSCFRIDCSFCKSCRFCDIISTRWEDH